MQQEQVVLTSYEERQLLYLIGACAMKQNNDEYAGLLNCHRYACFFCQL